MSKSLKNFISVREYLRGNAQEVAEREEERERESAHREADVFRFFCLFTHYRKDVELSRGKRREAEKAYTQIADFMKNIQAHLQSKQSLPSNWVAEKLTPIESQILNRISNCERHMTDHFASDFMTPSALRALVMLVNEVRHGNLTGTSEERDIPLTDAGSERLEREREGEEKKGEGEGEESEKEEGKDESEVFAAYGERGCVYIRNFVANYLKIFGANLLFLLLSPSLSPSFSRSHPIACRIPFSRPLPNFLHFSFTLFLLSNYRFFIYEREGNIKHVHPVSSRCPADCTLAFIQLT